MNKCKRIWICVFAVAALVMVPFETSAAGPKSPEEIAVNQMTMCVGQMGSNCLNQASEKLTILASSAKEVYTPPLAGTRVGPKSPEDVAMEEMTSCVEWIDSKCFNQASAKLRALSSKAGSKFTPDEADEVIWNFETKLINKNLMLCTKQKNQQCMAALQRQLIVRSIDRCPSLATRHQCPVTASDKDGDGIADAEEDRLLARFSPYYRFTRDHGAEEHFNPTDPIWAIRHSELQKGADENATPLIPKDCSGNNRICLSKDPKQLIIGATQRCLLRIETEGGKGIGLPFRMKEIMGSSDLWTTPERSNCRLNIFNDFRKGADLKEVLSKRNVGLFGHVVPIVDKYKSCSLCGRNTNKPKCKYSIEYYQFFAYNNAALFWDLGDHEGDWTILTVIYDPNTDKIERVSHWVHGGKISFNMATSHGSLITEGGNVMEYRGPNCCKAPPQIKLGGDPPSQMHDHILRLYRDPTTRVYSHPVVYVEYGTHEYWPSEHWSYQYLPEHSGDSYHYLTANPPNLGEVEHPRGDHAEIILRFNGWWGGWGRINCCPSGPALHKSWIWPAGSKLRCRIPDSSFQ